MCVGAAEMEGPLSRKDARREGRGDQGRPRPAHGSAGRAPKGGAMEPPTAPVKEQGGRAQGRGHAESGEWCA
jgi:hypothetical protein